VIFFKRVSALEAASIGGVSTYRQLARVTLRDLRLRLSPRELVSSIAIVAVSSTLAVWLEPFLGLVAAALLFVLGVMVVGALHGVAAALAAAFAAFLIYNFYLTEPLFTVRLAAERDLVPFFAFNVAALIAGLLAGRLQDRAKAAQRANLQLASLLETSQDMQAAVTPGDVLARLSGSAPVRLGLRLHVFRHDRGHLVDTNAAAAPDARLKEAADTVWSTGSPFDRDHLKAVPLRGSQGAMGVLVADGDEGEEVISVAFLGALANVLALALERAQFSERVAEAAALTKSEELKTALLSSVSHDLRTPLAAISASASSLVEYRDKLTAEASGKLLRGIVDECERLNRYTGNLLEMSKLQAGLRPKGQVLDVIEVAGSVLQRIRGKLGERKLDRHLPSDALLIEADAVLFELALTNLLVNAITYSDDGARIEVRVARLDGEAAIDVADNGFGIPPEDLTRVFERFQRVARYEPTPRGSGLGLAIARGFVEAFGGRIWAEVPGLDGRGTRIAIRLPLANGAHR
jgi:two-component system sensor histidine kinase KdpD